MVENVLTRKRVSVKTKLTVKAIVSLGIIALAVILPQIAHVVAGAQSGMKWLPMYLPVILGGCLLGVKWGVVVGALSPVASFFVTSIAGNPMPMAERLPFMVAELAVFALVAGLFSKKITENPLFSFPAILLSFVCGRLFFLLSVAVFENATTLKTAVVWSQIQMGFVGIIAQAVVLPLVVIGINKVLKNEQRNK
jgi:riboflavin transporter FmnP